MEDIEEASERLQKSLTLLTSHKPPDCISGTFVLLHIIQNATECLSKLLATQDVVLAVLIRLKDLLKSQVQVAKEDLCLASREGPMYGTLLCLKHVLKLANNINFTDELLDLCYQATDAVAEVVNNDSPEGHLPMDLQSKHGADRSVSAQMLLLCAWRTVKDCCLLLGDLCHRNLSESQLMALSDYFVELLSEIKHRGAFEQAYVGFCQLCSQLWHHPTLLSVPKKLLRDSLNALRSQTDKICATRRSAGFPFLIQGVLATDPDPKQELLKSTLKELFELSRDETNEDLRVHGCNILRVLFRDSQLGDVMVLYAGDGLVVAIDGFKAASWPVSCLSHTVKPV